MPTKWVAAPVGSIVMWGTPTPPANWTWCGGQSLPRAGYPALFAVIGTTFGAVDGAHFNMPQLFGAFPFGYGGQAPLGTMGGEVNHTLLANEMPVHNHVDAGHGHGVNEAPHSHTLQGSMGGGIGGTTPPTVHNSFGGTVPVTNPASTGISIQGGAANIQNAGGGAAHNNMPPYTVIGFIMRYQ